ncbi:MAG: anhydro-N-acetylmuramic acid kinase [Pseudomonadota bacterium]
MDAWARRELGLDFDRDGAWSAEHKHDEALLQRLLATPYFDTSGPRSTGPELFNLDWLQTCLEGDEPSGVVQATLAELTAESVFRSLHSNHGLPTAVFVCGGGARNTDLMRRLHDKLEPSGTRLSTTDELGLSAEWVEAAAFAWLAHQRLANRPANVPVVTGASGLRMLGAIYPAPLPVL